MYFATVLNTLQKTHASRLKMKINARSTTRRDFRTDLVALRTSDVPQLAPFSAAP